MRSIILVSIICLTTLFTQDSKRESYKYYYDAYEAYKNKNYVLSESLFEKSYELNNDLIYAAYMIGYLNLYYLDNINFVKAIKYLSLIENYLPGDINDNYFYNHLGVAYLYYAIDKKQNKKYYKNELTRSQTCFEKALLTEKNDMTYNNLGRTLMEYEVLDSLFSSLKYFDLALSFNKYQAYIHNKATALERIAHYYSGLVKSEKEDYEYLKKSWDYFIKAIDLYKSNKGYTKSQQRAALVEKIYITRKVYDQFRDKK